MKPKNKPFQCHCSGNCQFHTNEPGKKKHKPYAKINFEEIRELVDNPQEVDKSQA